MWSIALFDKQCTLIVILELLCLVDVEDKSCRRKAGKLFSVLQPWRACRWWVGLATPPKAAHGYW